VKRIMKKWILIGVGAVIVMISLILGLGISNMGPLIKSAVDTYGPGITKTRVTLQDVRVSLFSGEARLKGFCLGNPRGFKARDAVRVKSIHLDLDEGSLMKDPVIIDRIEIVCPEITYEKANGTDNFSTIIDNVRKTVGGSESPQERPRGPRKGKKLIIRDFTIKGGKVILAMPFLGVENVCAALPDIHLKNVGGEKGGASPAKVSEEILAALHGGITSAAVTDALNKHFKAMGKSLEAVTGGVKMHLETVIKGTKEGGGRVFGTVRGLFRGQ
jgi:hypothetical protein